MSTWAADVLYWLVAPRSATNIRGLKLWAQSEGMPGWANNWLSSTLPEPGATNWNTAGVKVYPTYNAGISATVTSLSLDPYKGIVQVLKTNAGLYALWQAIQESPWCGYPNCKGLGDQTGHYPVALWQAIGRPSVPKPVTKQQAAKITSGQTEVHTKYENLRAYANRGLSTQWQQWERLTNAIRQI